jgi:SulP family sulfate permease
MVVTFVATLFLPLQEAIFFGVALSFAVFAYTESKNTTLVELVTDAAGYPVESPAPAVLPDNKVTLLNIYGSLFFAGAKNLEENLPDVDNTHNAVVILNLRSYDELGATFITVLERYVKELQKNGNTLMLVSVSPSVYDQFVKTGRLTILGEQNIFQLNVQGDTTKEANERAKQLINKHPTGN